MDATDLPQCLHQPGPDFSFPKRSFGKKTVVQWSFQHAWFSFLHYNEAEDTVFYFTCRKMSKEKKNKTSTKTDFILSSKQIIKSIVVYFLLKFMVNSIWSDLCETIKMFFS